MYIADIASATPNRTAIVMAGTGCTVSYGELDVRSVELARLLRSCGIVAGDHIAIVAENGPFFFEAAVAAHRSGVHYTTVNTHLTPDEMSYVIRDSGSRAILLGQAMQELVARLDLGGSEVMVHIVDGAGTGTTAWAESDSRYAIVPSAAVRDTSNVTPWRDEFAGSPMLYSSGTTGQPKGVEFPLSQAHPRVVDTFTSHFVNMFGIDQETVFLLPGPLYHTSPLFYANMVLRVGGALIVMERFEPEATLRAIEDHRVTHSFFVPTMLIRMLRLPDEVKQGYDLSSHRFSLHGAAPCPQEVKLALRDWWGSIIWEGYAGSERNGMTILSPSDAIEHASSVGRPVGCDVIIASPDGERLGTGETGIVYFGGGYEFAYHNDPEKTAAAYLIPGVSTLGDIGHLGDDGFLYLTDRLADVVISGGVNIYPQEVEAALALHPVIADVAVIGVPDDDMGEVVKAIVQLLPGTSASDELGADIIAYCRSRIARYKCPRSVEFIEEMPRKPNGKLVKRSLRDQSFR